MVTITLTEQEAQSLHQLLIIAAKHQNSDASIIHAVDFFMRKIEEGVVKYQQQLAQQASQPAQPQQAPTTPPTT